METFPPECAILRTFQSAQPTSREIRNKILGPGLLSSLGLTSQLVELADNTKADATTTLHLQFHPNKTPPARKGASPVRGCRPDQPLHCRFFASGWSRNCTSPNNRNRRRHPFSGQSRCRWREQIEYPLVDGRAQTARSEELIIKLRDVPGG